MILGVYLVLHFVGLVVMCITDPSGLVEKKYGPRLTESEQPSTLTPRPEEATMKYIAIVNTPGYLPDDDEQHIFDTPAEAWWYLYHERCDHERDNECDLCYDTLSHGPNGDCDDDSETGDALSGMAKKGVPGVVYGPTPDHRGDHDLGLAYSVESIDLMDVEGTPEFAAAHGEPMGADE